MDARELKPKFSRVDWCVAVWLAIVLAVGLWQGYSTWLFGGRDAG